MRVSPFAGPVLGIALLTLPHPVAAAEPSAATCTAGGQSASAVVVYEQPGVRHAESLTLRLEYPPVLVTLPDTGTSPELTKRLVKEPANTVVGASNKDGALRIVASRAQGFEPGDLLTVRFDRCRGAREHCARPGLRCRADTGLRPRHEIIASQQRSRSRLSRILVN